MTEPPDRLGATEALDEALGLTELTRGEVPATVRTWLARLALLYGVPFEHLVPDATMLPPESIRFFHVDSNWLEALVDGAFSVGVHSQRDIRFHRVLHPAIRDATDEAAGTLRRELRDPTGSGAAGDEPAGEHPADLRVRAGFLLRSEIVSGWPGLEVSGYTDADRTTEVEIIRLDRLVPDLMLCLFASTPGLIVINEPREGLHHGVDTATIAWRDDLAPGLRTVPWRGSPQRRRVNMNVLAERVATGETFGPADFAAVMVDPPKEQHFVTREVP